MTVPVNIDNPDPAGSGGLVGARWPLTTTPRCSPLSACKRGPPTPAAGWDLEDTVNQASGLLGISLLNTNGTPNTSTIGGNLVLITFDVNSTRRPGPSPINLVPSNTPGVLTVTTSLTAENGNYDLPPRPLHQCLVAGVDGIVTVNNNLVVTGFAPTPTGFTVTFSRPFNPSTVNLYTTASLPDDVILATASAQVSVRGSLCSTPPTPASRSSRPTTSSAGTFNPGQGPLAPGKYTVTLRSFTAGGGGFEDLLGNPLDGTGISPAITSSRSPSAHRWRSAFPTLPVAVEHRCDLFPARP